MTPIKLIAWRGVKVFSVDHADQLNLLCVALGEAGARWLASSLARAHSVPCRELDSDGQMTTV